MGATALRTENLTKRFGRVLALDGLDLTVLAGEVFGFLGPNGAGKSTTIRLVLGLIRPSAGRAWVFGVDAANVARSHRLLAHVPADVALWPRLTGAETLELLGRTGPGVDLAYRTELVERFALDPSRGAGTNSTGNRQKVALVAAFATRAPVLVLDEPTSGLDPLMEREFRTAVRAARERGQAVFLSSHQLAEVEAVCDRVAILRAGRLVDVASVEHLRRLHRTEVRAGFTGAPPDLTTVPGVDALDVTTMDGGPAGIATRGRWLPVAGHRRKRPRTGVGHERLPYAHLATVPAEPPDWPGTVAMLAVAATLTAIGLRAYQRRDLRLA
jgi:ABC-2 type transport system ATP-binding protein